MQYIFFNVYDLSIKEQFLDNIKTGKVLIMKCINCGNHNHSTVYYCKKCGKKNFDNLIINGNGHVETFTIITVPPTGFEKYIPYAWIVMTLDDSNLRISGFMEKISSPTEIPIGTKVTITGFDERGILITKK